MVPFSAAMSRTVSTCANSVALLLLLMLLLSRTHFRAHVAEYVACLYLQFIHRIGLLFAQVAVLLGTVVMCASSVVLLLSRNQIGRLFSSEHGVVMLTAQAVPPLAVSLIGEYGYVHQGVHIGVAAVEVTASTAAAAAPAC